MDESHCSDPCVRSRSRDLRAQVAFDLVEEDAQRGGRAREGCG